MAHIANVQILPLEPAHVTSIPKGVDVTLRAEITPSESKALWKGQYQIVVEADCIELKDLSILDEDVEIVSKEHNHIWFKTSNPQKVVSIRTVLGTRAVQAGQTYPVKLTLRNDNNNVLGENTAFLNIARDDGATPVVIASKQPVATEWTDDVILFELIKKSTKDLEFNNYKAHMDFLLCNIDNEVARCVKNLFQGPNSPQKPPLLDRRFLPFNDTDAYRFLKVATEAFVMVKSAVNPATFKHCLCDDDKELLDDDGPDGLKEIAKRINALVNFPDQGGARSQYQRKYIKDFDLPIDKDNPTLESNKDILPYLHLISKRLSLELKDQIFPVMGDTVRRENEKCNGLIRYKLTCPIMIELIWSYWHEQGMHAQTLYAIRDRFQNRRSGPMPDPLAAMEIGVLRPLNNILWGYIQDEQHRLTITRRCYEYDHHYGLTLQGKAVPSIQPVDSRSKFLEAFHNLLYLCTVFFKEDDDTNRKADAFPVLNAIKEVHFLLSEGAHNQFGDLPTTARIEMLMEQWLLARPEMREFLPSRESIAYPEDWMGPVDSMKTIQGWTNTSSLYFHDLAVFGEQILLSIRYNNWSQIFDRSHAANWAKIWRSEIQGYMHAYRTVTGVDITVEPTEPRLEERKADPGMLLAKRLEEQRRIGTATRGGSRLPASPTAGIRVPVPRKV